MVQMNPSIEQKQTHRQIRLVVAKGEGGAEEGGTGSLG